MKRRVGISLAIRSLGAVATVAHAEGPKASYTADPLASRLEFAGTQAAAQFKGVFRRFTAVIDFDPDVLPRSHLDVQIDLNSLDTKDKDRDEIMRGRDIFDVGRFPSAHYVTRSVTKTAAGYSAAGALVDRVSCSGPRRGEQVLNCTAGAPFLAEAHPTFGANGVRYYQYVREDDLRLTHTSVPPQANRAVSTAKQVPPA